MDERLKKQIVYFLIFLSPFLVLTAIYFYKFLKPQPTCFDNIKNQGEIDVDCGGPCPPCEIKNLQPIVKYPVKSIIYPDGSSDFYFEIYNPNSDWGLRELGYYLIFYDNEEKIIYKTKTEKTILNPREKRILIFQNLQPPQFSKVEAELIIDNFNWKKISSPQLDLIFYSPQIFENDLKLTSVRFEVYNRSIFDFANIEGIIILYNSLKEPIGLTRTSFSLKSEETKTIEVNFPFKLEAQFVNIFFQTKEFKNEETNFNRD